MWTWPSGIGPSLMQLPHVARHLIIALRCFLVHAYAGTPGAQRPSRPHRSHCWLPISFSHSGGGGGDDHGGGGELRRPHLELTSGGLKRFCTEMGVRS